MTRGLVAFMFVACMLAGTAVACGAPTHPSVDPTVAQAQSTAVRRTEVAAVQRIIANNPPATSTPAPTAAPLPACQAPGAIWWYEVRAHVGESRTVQGTVLASRAAPGGLALLEVGQRYPDPISFAVLVPAAASLPRDGTTVCVAGQITTVEGRPMMHLRTSASLLVLE